MRCIFLINLVLFWPFLGLAVSPNEILLNPSLEKEAREISKGLRCLVCQNESIKDSNAPLANQLRSVIYEQMAQGKDDAEITFFLRSRYGEFINYAPKFSWETCLLWLLPLTTLAWAALYLFCKKKKPCL